MSIQITYDNFTFKDPIPFVSKNQEIINYGDRWGQITKITLQGQLTGACPDDFKALITGQNNLISGFSRDFKKLSITEENKTLFEADSCIIRNINFDQSKYVKLLDYTIELDCYEKNLFSGVYGVLDPINEYVFTENQDKSVSITHNISARGIDTPNYSAFDNAKNYVNSLIGYNSNILPKNINTTNWTPLIRSYTENINRLNGTYNIQENYIVDIANAGTSYFTRYTTNVSKDIVSDFSTVSVQGSIQGAKDSNFENMKSYAASLNLYGICSNVIEETLNTIPIALSFEENETAKLINFNASFDTNLLGGNADEAYYDYTVEIDRDMITSLCTVNISGPIKSKGNLKERYEKVKAFLGSKNVTYLYGLASSTYNTFKQIMNIPGNISLNPRAKNFSIVKNPERGEIIFSASFDDKDVPPTQDARSVSFNIGVEPTILLFRPRPTYHVNGFYIVYELGDAKKIDKFSINATTEFSSSTNVSDGKTQQKAIIEKLYNTYSLGGTYYIENQSSSFEENNGITKTASSSVKYSSKEGGGTPFLPGKIGI